MAIPADEASWRIEARPIAVEGGRLGPGGETGPRRAACRTGGVENLRPETRAMIETGLRVYGDAKDVVLGVEGAGN